MLFHVERLCFDGKVSGDPCKVRHLLGDCGLKLFHVEHSAYVSLERLTIRIAVCKIVFSN